MVRIRQNSDGSGHRQNIPQTNNLYSLKESAINGNNADKKKEQDKKLPLVNGKCNNFLANEISTMNGNCNNLQLVNGYFKNDAPTVNNRNSSDEANPNVSKLNGNYDGFPVPKEVPPMNGICSNASSENGSSNYKCNSLCNDNSDENQEGFIEVVNKKKRSKQKNRWKKSISNLPPALNGTNIRSDNANDKKFAKKTSSPTHLSQMPSKGCFPIYRSSEKTYSSVLSNGQSSCLKTKNDASNCSETRNLIKTTNNCDLQETVGQLSADLAKNIVIKDSSVRCEQSDLSTKVELTDFSAKMEICSLHNLPQNPQKCLDSSELIPEPEGVPFPYDCTTDSENQPVGASNTTYCESVVSNDSGRGDSEVRYDNRMPYFCEFPKDKVSLLIGQRGQYKKEIEKQTGVKLWVVSEISVDLHTTIVKFEGTGAQIENALNIIKNRFHLDSLVRWNAITNEQVLINGPPLSENFIPVLHCGTQFPGVVSAFINPNFFWVQQLGHPNVFQLEDLEIKMSNHFNTVTDVPEVDNPQIGNVVVVPYTIDVANVRWWRGEIVNITTQGTLIINYLDHGGEVEVSAEAIRPMRPEFLKIPFIASKCALFGIKPSAGGEWSEEANDEFKRLCCNGTYSPFVQVMCNMADYYYVNIIAYDAQVQTNVSVANVLVEKGFAEVICMDYQNEVQGEVNNELV